MGPIAVEMSEKASSESLVMESRSLTPDQNNGLCVNKVPSAQVVKLVSRLSDLLRSAECCAVKSTHSLGKLPCSEQVTSSQCDEAVSNLRFLHIWYGFRPETFAMAVALLDRFLTKVKAQTKYLSCIVTSCYYIAVKTCEEDEDIPYSQQLLQVSQIGCTPADLTRMEGIILDKLNWEINITTPLHLLQSIYAILQTQHPETFKDNLLRVLITRLEVCMCRWSYRKYSAATLVMSLLICTLEKHTNIPEQVWTSMMTVQHIAQVSDCDLFNCRGVLSEFLDTLYRQTVKPTKLPVIMKRPYCQRRPSFYGESELSTISETEDSEDSCNSPFDSDSTPQTSPMSEEDHQQHNHSVFVYPPDTKVCKLSEKLDKCYELPYTGITDTR